MSSVGYNMPHLASHPFVDSNLVKGSCRNEYPNSNKKLIESLTSAIHQLNTFVMEPPTKFNVVDSVISKATNARNELVSFLSYLNSISNIQRRTHTIPHHGEVSANDSSESPTRSPSPTPQYSPSKFHGEYGSYSAPPPSQQIRPSQADSITAQSHPGDGDLGYGGYCSDVFSEYQTTSHSEYLREDSETYDTAMGVVAGILTPSASPAPPPHGSTTTSTTTASPPNQQQQQASQLPTVQSQSRVSETSSSQRTKKSSKRGNKKSRKSSSNSSTSASALNGNLSSPSAGRIGNGTVSACHKKRQSSGVNVAGSDLFGSGPSSRSTTDISTNKDGSSSHRNGKHRSATLPSTLPPNHRVSPQKGPTATKSRKKSQQHSQSHVKKRLQQSTVSHAAQPRSTAETQATSGGIAESYEQSMGATGSRVSLTPPPMSRLAQHQNNGFEIGNGFTPSPRHRDSSSTSSRELSHESPQPESNSASPLRSLQQTNTSNALSPGTAVRIAVAAMKSREHSNSQTSSAATDSPPRSCDTSENSVSGSGSDSGSAGEIQEKEMRRSHSADQTPSWSSLCGQKTTSSLTRKLRTRPTSSSDAAKSNPTAKPRPVRTPTNKLRRTQTINSKTITTSTTMTSSPRKPSTTNTAASSSPSSSDTNRSRVRPNAKQQPTQSNRTSAPRHSKRRGNDDSLMRRVFVSNLPHDATDEQIRQTFSACGEIQHTVWFPSRTDGRFYGSGLITFNDMEGAAIAVSWNKKTVLGRTIRVEYSACQDPIKEKPPGCCTTYLNNVPFDITEERIRQVFKHCGRILRVRFHERDGQRTGGAFVQFQDTHAADKALLMHGSIVDGFPLYVDYQRY